tara:strand:+ start:2022 stop:2192 length:171 start_codon:yes stop_codon:yes gene_type:complete
MPLDFAIEFDDVVLATFLALDLLVHVEVPVADVKATHEVVPVMLPVMLAVRAVDVL